MRIHEVSKWPTASAGPSKVSNTNVRRLIVAKWLIDAGCSRMEKLGQLCVEFLFRSGLNW